jgi:EmrB/QacA subfamily drug resistance transporter
MSVSSTALPSRLRSRHGAHPGVAVLGVASVTQQWVVNAYALTFAGFLMLGGRAALGVGSAVLAPASLSLLTATFTEPHERRRALGVWSATASSGAAGGLIMGGLLTDLIGWRWVLFVNVPVGIVLFAVALSSLQESTAQQERRGLDVAGAVTVTAGMAALIYGIVGTDSHPWGSTRTLTTIGAGLLLLALFVAIEARGALNPIVPLRTFRRRSLSVANVLAMAVGASVFATYFFVSLYLQQVKHYSPLHAGIAFLPIGLFTLVGALIASRLVRRIGIRPQLVLTPLLTAVAVISMSFIGPRSGYVTALFIPLVVAGLAIGLSFVPLTLAATMGVPTSEAGLASGLLNTSRQLGGALGLAALTTVSAAAAKTELVHGATVATALSHGYGRALLIAGLVSVAGGLSALFFGGSVQLPPAQQ